MMEQLTFEATSEAIRMWNDPEAEDGEHMARMMKYSEASLDVRSSQ